MNTVYLTTKEVAEMLKVNERTIIKLCNDNQLEYSKVGKLYRITESSLEYYLQNNK